MHAKWKVFLNLLLLLLLSRPSRVRLPHRRQPNRLPRPWDSPGKNTGEGCHCLLQCIKVKSESEVALTDTVVRQHRGPSPWAVLGRVQDSWVLAHSTAGKQGKPQVQGRERYCSPEGPALLPLHPLDQWVHTATTHPPSIIPWPCLHPHTPALSTCPGPDPMGGSIGDQASHGICPQLSILLGPVR